MDQIGFAGQGIRNTRGADLPPALTLPSRASALEALRSGLDSQAGPVLLTGESGVGKTWVCDRLMEGTEHGWRWAAVDLTPAVGPEGFYRLLLRSLAVEVGSTTDAVTGRAAVEDVLAEENEAGTRRFMVIDEAQNGSVAVLEEVRILSNALGSRSGFAGVLLVAGNGLSRRLSFRTLRALETRVATRVDLRSLEYDEFTTFAAELNPELVRDAETLERLHRTVNGNPLLTRRAASAYGPQTRRAVRIARPSIPEPASAALSCTTGGELSPGRSGRPPIRVEDGMVEVGWLEPTAGEASGTESAESGSTSETTGVVDAPHPSPEPEERIHDPYAAIQAWGEWNLAGGETPTDSEEETLDQVKTLGSVELKDTGSVWAEGQHVFAPYSQLFSRLRPSREPT